MPNKGNCGLIVGVIGTIGSGKTTLGRLLSEENSWSFLEEEWASNPYVIGKRAKKSSQLEISLGFLLMRKKQNKEAVRLKKQGKTVLLDTTFEMTDLYSRSTLDNTEYKIFKEIYECFAENISFPDAIVYLNGDHKVFIERALKRKWGIRLEKELINKKVLKSADTLIKKHLRSIAKCKIIFLDTTKIDIRNKETIKSISEKIIKIAKLRSIEDLAQALYDPNLPYHNFDHVLGAIEAGKTIVGNCKKEGVEIDEEVVHYALLFHDAGYHEDHVKKGFKNKEEYSAHLAEVGLQKLKINKEFIEKVKRAIISTNQNEKFETNEKKAVRAADLAGMAGDYGDFLENNKRLKEEYLFLTGKDLSWEQWREETKKVIGFYLCQDIHLTSKYADERGESVFHKKTKENLKRFLKEDIENLK